ncbi:MAG: hypothetical protein RBT59_13595 [Arcobacteraceae bacterium]|jgi:hypothetical protein|nr:hypothetical protein [Arcobacteraceae bacterium]
MISITLARKNDNKKFNESTLDAYSLRKYKTLYCESKTKVNADLKALSVKYQTVTPKDITMLLFAEMLSGKDKNLFLEKHLKEISKFDD